MGLIIQFVYFFLMDITIITPPETCDCTAVFVGVICTHFIYSNELPKSKIYLIDQMEFHLIKIKLGGSFG